MKFKFTPFTLFLILVLSLSLIAAIVPLEVEKYVLMIAGLVLGFWPGMNLLQIIKKIFNVHDTVAQIAVAVIALGLASALLFVFKVVTFADFTLDNFNAIYGMFFAAATIAYRAFMKKA